MNTSAWESTECFGNAMDSWLQMLRSYDSPGRGIFSETVATFVLFWAVVYINVACPNLGLMLCCHWKGRIVESHVAVQKAFLIPSNIQRLSAETMKWISFAFGPFLELVNHLQVLSRWMASAFDAVTCSWFLRKSTVAVWATIKDYDIAPTCTCTDRRSEREKDWHERLLLLHPVLFSWDDVNN